MSPTGHELIARGLRLAGIELVYCVSGTPVAPTLAACARDGLRVVGMRDQLAAGLASAAHNRSAGSLRSAVVVSAGPAVTRCTTAISVAHDNAWPLLVIGGRRPLAMSGRGTFQDLDGVRLFASISKAARLFATAAELAAGLADACRTACDGRPGPVYVDVTEEALDGRAAHSPPAPGAHRGDPLPSTTRLDAAADVLRASRRPALLVGDAARWGSPWPLLRRLTDDHRWPYAAAPLARGFLPESHPLDMSEARGALLAGADAVLAVGTRFDWTIRFGAEVAPRAAVVCVGHDANESVAALGRGNALAGDVGPILAALLHRLDPAAPRDDAARCDALARQVAARRAEVAALCGDDGVPMSPYRWLADIAVALPRDAVTVLDGNVVMAAAQRVLHVAQPLGRINAGHSGCMGTGIPFAIGAKLADPSRPVVAIVGDFAFGLAALELEAAVRYRVPIVVVVGNNGGHGGSTRQHAYYPPGADPVCLFGDDVRHDALAAALGARAVRVERPGELTAALREALERDDVPTCIDVVTRGDVELAPML